MVLNEPFVHEHRIRRFDGQWRWMSVHAAPIRNHGGQVSEWIGMNLDVTERKLSEDALREARDTREAILQSMTDGLIIANPAGQVIDINPAAERLLGFTGQEDRFSTLTDYAELFEFRNLTGEQQSLEQLPLARACRGEVFTNHELEVRRRDTGRTLIISCGGAAVRDAGGNVRFGIVTFRDISDQKQAEARIAQLAFYDSLTGLPNRRLFEERLAVALAQMKRQGTPVAVMALDLDRFKAINDALGHTIGDTLLVEVARRMTACMRASDTVARPGGDEFMLVLQGVEAEGAAHLAEKLVASLADPIHLDGHELTIGCSLGISLAPRDSDTAGELITRADTAMYRAKQSGRNRYQFFTQEMQREALRTMLLEHQLRQALGGGELCLHYQPQIELVSNRPIGFEALVRWRHPSRGLLDARHFVPIAENSGLIFDLGAWVLRAAIEQLQTWSQAGLPLLPVAVNLSAQQFRHRDRRRALSTQVTDLLKATGLASALLELEITENSLLEETEETRDTLEALRALGLRLTLDDFGTGYSSLSSLNAFPVDRLKIDQSFVRAAPRHPKQAAIVEAILALGRHLEFEVIAEGVETADQVAQLMQQGCRQAQGHYFSPPLPPADAANWLRRRPETAMPVENGCETPPSWFPM